MNKVANLFYSLLLAGVVLLGVSLLLMGNSPPVRAADATLYVSSVSGEDTGDCTNEEAPCQTIQL